MVRFPLSCIVVLIVISCEDISAQIFTAPVLDSTAAFQEFFDPSLISNEIFLQTSEDIYGDELQFISDELDRLASNPVMLNKATWKDLQQILTLSDMDIQKILLARKTGNELSRDLLAREHSFISRNTHSSHENISLQTRVEVDPDASKGSNYQSGYYHGSPVKTSSRLVARTDAFLFSLVEAKDPGEPLYFDHLTGCVAITAPISFGDKISLSKLVLGDYSLSYGSGLLFSNNISQFTTNRVTLNAAPHSSGIQPYISSSSYRYFRGASAEITSGILSVSGFFSDRSIDATLDSSGKNILALPSSSYHRTVLELSRKDAAQANLSGGHIAITPLQDDNFLEFGATAYSLEYNKIVAPADSNKFGFKGQNHSMISADIRSAFSQISLCGEFAHMISDAGKANAYTMTLLTDPLRWFEVSLNYRKLPENFISPFGATFGINAADAQNETGWYVGSRVTAIASTLWFFGSANISESQKPDNSELHYSDISLGSEYSFKILPVTLKFQFRSYGRGPLFSLSGDSLSKRSLSIDLHSDLTTTFGLSLRGEIQRSYSITDSLPKNGHLFGIKFHYLPITALSVSSGISFYETDSYASRLYSDEAGLPGTVPFVALYGSGFRYYLQCSYYLGNVLSFSAQVAESSYSPAPTSSRLHKTSLGAECELTF